jgi:MFS family permease
MPVPRVPVDQLRDRPNRTVPLPIHLRVRNYAVVTQIGSFVGGVLSDVVGRKWVLICGVALMFAGTVVNFWDVYVGFLLVGLGCGPANNVSFVYVTETVDKGREQWCVFLVCGWATGEIVLGGLFYGGWTLQVYYGVFCACTAMLLVMSCLFLKETPAFL